jgi:cyanophycinase
MPNTFHWSRTFDASTRRAIPSVVAAFVVLWVTTASAQQFDEQYSHWPVDLKIHGNILIDHDVQDWKDLQPILVRLTKSKSVACFSHQAASSKSLPDALKEAVGDEGHVDVSSFTTLPGDELKAAMASASVVVLHAGDGYSADLAALLKIKPQFDQFLADGGTLIVDTQVGKLLGKYALQKTPNAADEPGLNLIPDSVLLCEYDDQGTSRADLLKAAARHPRTVGIGLERGAVLMLSGRKVTCHGSGQAKFVLAGCDHSPPRVETISAARSNRQASLLDLTEWRRDAIDRTLEPFPPAKVETPLVENGTLVIVGGGGMPRGLMSRFVELAGGTENARLVYVPCLEDDDVSTEQGTVQGWKKMGVLHATMIHTKDRNRANSDDEFLEPLKDATGIWFGGGRQWNMADSYYGTKAHQMMKAVVQRGGVVGGSSAGASIQARYLARATPIGNTSIMAPGYERGGLGFISGVAIDQHFTQRGRQKDMTQLIKRHPQLLGIGLDEATAIIVQKSRAEVVGNGKVYFYDSEQPASAVQLDQPDYVALPAGSSYDLARRQVLVDTTEALDKKEATPKSTPTDDDEF